MAVRTVTTSSTVLIRKNARRAQILIQNTGTEPALIRVDGDPDTDNYDFILAADTGARAGSGGLVTIEKIQGEIRAIVENNSTTLAVKEIFG